MSWVYCPPKSRMRIVSNFDDIAPHYINRGEAHEKQVAVKKIEKHDCRTSYSQHRQRLAHPRYIQESGYHPDRHRSGDHCFKRYEYSYHAGDPDEVRPE